MVSEKTKEFMRSLGTIRKGPVPGMVVIVAFFCAVGVVQALFEGDTDRARTLTMITVALVAMGIFMFRVGR